MSTSRRDHTPDLDALDAAVTRFRRFIELPSVHAFVRDQLDRQVDLSLYRVLGAVKHAEHDAPSIGEVAEILDVDASTASRLIDRAVSNSLLERRASEEDRRRTEVCLTDAGLERLEQLRRARLELWREITRDWPREDVATLARLLDRTYDAGRSLDA